MKNIALVLAAMIVAMFLFTCKNQQEGNKQYLLLSDLVLRAQLARVNSDSLCDSLCDLVQGLYQASQQTDAMMARTVQSYSSTCCCPCDTTASAEKSLYATSGDNCPCPDLSQLMLAAPESMSASVQLDSTTLSAKTTDSVSLFSLEGKEDGTHTLTIRGNFGQGMRTFVIPVIIGKKKLYIKRE